MKRQCPIGKDLMITDTWVYFSSSSEQNNSLQLHIYISFSITLETHTQCAASYCALCLPTTPPINTHLHIIWFEN